MEFKNLPGRSLFSCSLTSACVTASESEGKSMPNKDEIKGKAKQVKGAIKENLGWLTNDPEAEGEGEAERAEGEVQEQGGRARRETEEIAEKLAERKTGGK